MVLEIVRYPNKILKVVCEHVEFPMTEATKQLCQNMKETCAHHKGLGLAANQVGFDLKIFVMRDKSSNLKAEDPACYKVFINPIIVAGSSKMWSTEGCLSLPNREYTVRRYRNITAAYYTEDGKIKNDVLFDGLESVIFQHEYEHLNGINLVDKLQK